VSDLASWREAVALLEAGEFWAAHEALEGSWLTAEGTDKEFLGGVILLAAALHKARAQGSSRGALRNYAKALRHLALVPDEYRGVEVRELEARVHRALRDPAVSVRVPLALGTDSRRVGHESVPA
jgi:predicted metal-dependent hydrolase